MFDVAIIGAGAAGLMAALELVKTGKKVAVVEARSRIGGRADTVQDPLFDLPVEQGAEFVHGDLEPTLSLLKSAGIPYHKIEGELWQHHEGGLQKQEDFVSDFSALEKKFKQLKEDISVQEFIDNYLQEPEYEELRFTLKNYVEGYYAAEASRASTFALKEELEQPEEDQYRIEGGYRKLLLHLYQDCKKREVIFYFDAPVSEINWSQSKIVMQTPEEKIEASKVLITVPIGVLQQENIHFMPALPEYNAAAKKLGFGPVIKTVLQFRTAFWKDPQRTRGKNLAKLNFLFSKETIPTWWTYYPQNTRMITGWSAGPNARALDGLSRERILDEALLSLSTIFGLPLALVRSELVASRITDWDADPHSCGGYSYEVVGGAEAKKILNTPVEDRIFFAGEGLYEGPEIGTVNAAFVTGRETAYRIVASFKK